MPRREIPSTRRRSSVGAEARILRDLMRPAGGYSVEALSTVRRAPVVYLSRSQKDLWDKDVDYPDSTHTWAKRVKKELNSQVFKPVCRAPDDSGNFLMFVPPKEETRQSDTIYRRNQSHLEYTSDGLVASHLDRSLAQAKTYGRRPGASEWTTSYNCFWQDPKNLDHKGELRRKLFIAPAKKKLPKVYQSRSAAHAHAHPDPPEPEVKARQGNDLEIKKLAATLKRDGFVHPRSVSAEPTAGGGGGLVQPGAVVFDWRGYRPPMLSAKMQAIWAAVPPAMRKPQAE